jgi:hypothetical protein
MQGLTDNERKQVLGEILFDELKAIREAIANLPTREELNRLSEKVDNVAGDVKVIKAVVTDHEKEIQNIKRHPNLKMA